MPQLDISFKSGDYARDTGLHEGLSYAERGDLFTKLEQLLQEFEDQADTLGQMFH
jgi:hypothetical protein